MLATFYAIMTALVTNKPRVDLLHDFVRASNGFDMRGVTTAASTDGPLLSTEAAYWIGVGLCEWLQQEQQQQKQQQQPEQQVVRVGIGRDSRASGSALTSWLAGGIAAAGGTGYDVGLCTTPAMFLSCSSNSDSVNIPWPFDGAVSVTASHLPSIWNGFKFFTPTTPSNIGEEGIAGIIAAASLDKFDHLTPQPADAMQIHAPSFLPTYAAFLQGAVRDLVPTESPSQPLQGLKIVINAGNGAGGFLAQTLAELGADVSGSLHLSPDGTFPNHVANPEVSVGSDPPAPPHPGVPTPPLLCRRDMQDPKAIKVTAEQARPLCRQERALRHAHITSSIPAAVL